MVGVVTESQTVNLKTRFLKTQAIRFKTEARIKTQDTTIGTVPTVSTRLNESHKDNKTVTLLEAVAVADVVAMLLQCCASRIFAFVWRISLFDAFFLSNL